MPVLASRVLNFGDGAADEALKVDVSPSPLNVGDQWRIDIYAPEAYQMLSPYDALSKLPAYGPAQEFEEDVDVNNGGISTQYPVASIQSAYWLTGAVDTSTQHLVASIGQPVDVDVVNHRLDFDGTNLVGTLRIKYTAYLAQSWSHGAMNAGGLYALFYRKQGASDWQTLTVTVNGGTPDEQSQPSIVTVQAKDFCTDLPIEGATVFVDGQNYGVTDINGKRVIGLLPAGAHSVKIQASGYIPTDGDDLQNDSFQI